MLQVFRLVLHSRARHPICNKGAGGQALWQTLEPDA